MTGKLEKCKQFLPFLKRAGRMQGLVEYVASGSRFRVYIPRETCIITFLLGGISCPRGGRTMPDGTKVEADKFGDEAATHVKEMILQREVEIEVESQDKAGNFIGYLFCENSNLSVHLVTEGYATMHFTADRSNYCNQVQSRINKIATTYFICSGNSNMCFPLTDPECARQCEGCQEACLEGLCGV